MCNRRCQKRKHPEIRNRYLKIKKRRGHKRAIGHCPDALDRYLYDPEKERPYNAELYKKSDILPVSREITVEQAIALAKSQGYLILTGTWSFYLYFFSTIAWWFVCYAQN